MLRIGGSAAFGRLGVEHSLPGPPIHLLFVFGLLLPALRKLTAPFLERPPAWPTSAPVYAMAALSALWVIERTAALL